MSCCFAVPLHPVACHPRAAKAHVSEKSAPLVARPMPPCGAHGGGWVPHTPTKTSGPSLAKDVL